MSVIASVGWAAIEIAEEVCMNCISAFDVNKHSNGLIWLIQNKRWCLVEIFQPESMIVPRSVRSVWDRKWLPFEIKNLKLPTHRSQGSSVVEKAHEGSIRSCDLSLDGKISPATSAFVLIRFYWLQAW